ncbi:antibiotic biosynthesis monooxygenase [Dactylosporangium sp. AC04546]|uniref:antibiotic biosynthesis monooxygenase n=1 Tax=Dactylosporangium sp. AC04546 TaxID=2862460 RepID=UPI0027E11476|nr:antibiotic biosynthesis monooxygenase [Dactylosporangium sp. AC04546]WVK79062.1 antibiotic biosynthesis monooxygenase [Dactylosporangium sp. AC04546]
MTAFTIHDLGRLLQAAAGEPEPRDLGGAVLDTPFADLGYDSLAMLETTSRVEREFDVRIPDDTVAELATPRQFVDHVTARLGGATFRVVLRMDIRPGAEADFEEAWRKVGDAVTGNPGNLAQWLLRSTTEPGVYFVMSDWVDEARFREFERSEAHVAHRESLHPYRSRGSMDTMRAVHHMPGAAGAQR